MIISTSLLFCQSLFCELVDNKQVGSRHACTMLDAPRLTAPASMALHHPPEHVQGLWPVRQALLRCCCPDEGTLAGLGHAVVAGIQHAKAHLSHTTQEQQACSVSAINKASQLYKNSCARCLAALCARQMYQSQNI